MLIGCWSPKGGSGTSVVVAGLGRCAASSLLVDLAGELDAVLGVDTSGPGVEGWLAAGGSAAPDALARLEVEVEPGCTLLPCGERPVATGGRPVAGAALLGQLLAHDGRDVVVDAGTGTDPVAATVLEAVQLRLAVVRPCYLALRRLQARADTVDGVVLVEEPGRALRVADVEAAVGTPVIARVPWDPAVARAVDAGVLATRAPRVLLRSLRPVLQLAGSTR